MRTPHLLQSADAPVGVQNADRRPASRCPESAVRLAHAAAAANETLADRHDGWARHAWAANGFGDAIVAGADRAPEARSPVAELRAMPSSALPEPRTPWFEALVATAHRAVHAWRRRRSAQATEVALHELDARTLHDLGLDASEIRSVAGEVAGLATATRAHAVHVLCHRLF